MLPPDVGVLPSFKFRRVMVTATFASSTVPAVVITIEVEEGAPIGANAVPALEANPEGVKLEAKNPDG